jgi:hypothetical protein
MKYFYDIKFLRYGAFKKYERTVSLWMLSSINSIYIVEYIPDITPQSDDGDSIGCAEELKEENKYSPYCMITETLKCVLSNMSSAI